MTRFTSTKGPGWSRAVLADIAWESRTVPADWKMGVVVPNFFIFFKGDQRLCSNYRGVTLLRLSEKAYARVLERRIRLTIELRLEEEPSGFCLRRGKVYQIFILTKILTNVVLMASSALTWVVRSRVWSDGNEGQQLQIWGHGSRLENGGLPTLGGEWAAFPSAGVSRDLVHEWE